MKIEIVKHSYGKVVSDIDIFETDDTDAYNTIGKLIDKICEYAQYRGEMILSIGLKYHENDEYFIINEFFDGEDTFQNDWWEGEPYIRIYGWCFIDNLQFYPGSGDCWFITNTGRNRRWLND